MPAEKCGKNGVFFFPFLMDARNTDAEEKQFPLQSPPPPLHVASSPISHMEKAKSKATGRNTGGQTVTMVTNKTASKH